VDDVLRARVAGAALPVISLCAPPQLRLATPRQDHTAAAPLACPFDDHDQAYLAALAERSSGALT
jgi:hypothetical protein